MYWTRTTEITNSCHTRNCHTRKPITGIDLLLEQQALSRMLYWVNVKSYWSDLLPVCLLPQDIEALFVRPDGRSSTSPPPSPSKRSCPDPSTGAAVGSGCGVGGGASGGSGSSPAAGSGSGPSCALAPPLVGCERAHGNHWYLHFENEEHAQLAYRYLREVVRSFRGRPILVRTALYRLSPPRSTPELSIRSSTLRLLERIDACLMTLCNNLEKEYAYKCTFRWTSVK